MSIGAQAEVGDDAEVAGGLLVLVVVGQRQVEPVDHRAGDRPVGGGGDVREQQPHLGAEHPDQHEEVLVDRHQADGPPVAGVPAQLHAQPVEVRGQVVVELLELPDAFLAVGDESEVHAFRAGFCLLRHWSPPCHRRGR